MAVELFAQERRAHPRIAAPLRAYVLKGPIERVELPVRDISKRGLFLYTPTPPAPVGSNIEVELVTPEGTLSLVLTGRIVRAVMSHEDFQGIGVEFVEVTDQQRERLDELLKRLVAGSGGRRRAHPRIARQLTVRCSGSREARAILRDISQGGASLWTDFLPQEGDAVTLKLDVTRGGALELPGRVVFAEAASDGEPYHQVGIRFEGLNQKAFARLEAFLPSLLFE